MHESSSKGSPKMNLAGLILIYASEVSASRTNLLNACIANHLLASMARTKCGQHIFLVKYGHLLWSCLQYLVLRNSGKIIYSQDEI